MRDCESPLGIRHSRKLKNPWLLGESVPPTAALMAATSVLGPPMRVVPVSIAESAASPVEIVTGLPFTVTPVKEGTSISMYPLPIKR